MVLAYLSIKLQLQMRKELVILLYREKAMYGDLGKSASHAVSGTLNNCTINIRITRMHACSSVNSY